MKKLYLTGLLMVSIFGRFSLAENFPNPATRGVWISEDYLTGGPSAIESMMQTLSGENVNVIYVEVYSHGSTIYPSNVISNAGGPIQTKSFSGTDPLNTVIETAHRYGIEVFAWFASPFLLSQPSDSTQVPSILVNHPGWAAFQRDTSKNFFEPHSVYGYSFEVDPCVPAAADFIVNMFAECARNHPDLDGIEIDIENDTTGWYGDSTRALFMQETGNPDPLTLPDTNSAWLTWRRLQVTNVVQRIYEGVKAINPQCVISAAVDPPYYGLKLESWGVWAQNSYVDILEPMLYMSTGYFDSQLLWCIGNVPPGFQLSAGVAINSAGTVPSAISEMQDAVQRGTAGIVVWYYGYLLSYSGAMTSLKSQVFTDKTLPSYDDLLIDNADNGQYKTTGSWTTENGGYGGTYQSGSAVQGDTAIFTVRILRSGNYTLYGYWSGDSSSNSSRAIVLTTTSTLVRADTINQKLNLNTWQSVDRFALNSGDTVRIRLVGNGGGNLIADAFRLRRADPFVLGDYAIPDSQSVLLKFSNPLLLPLASITSVTTIPANGNVSASVDPSDNTILHVEVPPMQQGVPFTLNVSSILDVSLDTLSFSLALAYNPDSTMVLIDDATPNAFWKLSGTWVSDTSTSAVNGIYFAAKQGTQVDRVQWGPLQVNTDGYYDFSVHIPQMGVPLSTRCLYVVKDDFGADSIYTSQKSGVGTWVKLGNLPFSAGDQFAPTLSSVAGADTSQYLVADAVMLTRSVEFSTAVKELGRQPTVFQLDQNYPNPFNPTTVISYAIPRAEHVNLRVYDILGREVATLVNKEENVGRYSIQFDGSRFASGVYFYRLIAGNYIMTKKMLMVK